jgi:hypothetical protein
MTTERTAEPSGRRRRLGLYWFTLALGTYLVLLAVRSTVSVLLSHLGLFDYYNPHRETSVAEALAFERDSALFYLVTEVAPTTLCLIAIFAIGRRLQMSWIVFHWLAVTILAPVALLSLLTIGPFASDFWVLVGVQALTGILIPRPPPRGQPNYIGE